MATRTEQVYHNEGRKGGGVTLVGHGLYVSCELAPVLRQLRLYFRTTTRLLYFLFCFFMFRFKQDVRIDAAALIDRLGHLFYFYFLQKYTSY